ncbi:hypothetical protein [Vibrio splendidus]|uniref:hypothetical protein n=1 Tax=Vibrio splendidus TaxID=29497 RepID=UPI003D0F32ED
MKMCRTLILTLACTIPFNASAFLYYVIVDPAKIGQKANQITQDSVQFAQSKASAMKAMAADMNNVISEFENNDNLVAFQTATLSAGISETTNLATQSSMEQPVGLCSAIEYSVSDVSGDYGCALYGNQDGYQSSLVFELDSVTRAEQDLERLKTSVDSMQHRNPSTEMPNLHEEFNLIFFDVLGQAKLTELSNKDRDAMDMFVEHVSDSKSIKIPEITPDMSPEAKQTLLRKLREYLAQNASKSTMKSSYVFRSRSEQGLSQHSDIWHVRDNEVSDMEALGKPVMTGAGLALRPTSESIIRGEAIRTAREGRFLMALLEASLVNEFNLSLRTNTLAEVERNVR